MTPERWLQVRRVFDEVVALPYGESAGHLDRICIGDEELRREVESLLTSHQKAESVFLNIPLINLSFPIDGVGPPSRVGRRVGAYNVVEEIGRGGMGEVYRAARADGQYRKEVAIKLVRGGYDSVAVLDRFRHERQILASLDHPNIARLLDGGTTEDGVPYLVMELVQGKPIDVYCDEHVLNITARLKLFAQVCSAVQYAHQRLVIHRDIKPTNILVNGEGVPKLLDFGIAKILDPAMSAEITLGAPMTPEYASPEQIQGETITTSTDVYSLGVVLYRLLTGRSPYSANTRTPHDFVRKICELEPERPSTVISNRRHKTSMRTSEGLDAPASTNERLSRARGASPTKLRQQLAGDLDVIVLKALRKEPQRRYTSAEQLAEDIRRNLQGLPVVAVPDSMSYRTRKFVRRHALGVAASALILLVIVGGVAATLREARVADANRRKAELRFNEVRKLANSLMFEIHDSIEGTPGTTAARKLIVQRSEEYLDSLAHEATGDVSLQRELASAYERLGNVQGNAYNSNLGEPSAALGSLQKSLALRRAIVASSAATGADRAALATCYRLIGQVQWQSLGNVGEAAENLTTAVTTASEAVSRDQQNPRLLWELADDYNYLGDIQGGNGVRGTIGNLKLALENHRKSSAIFQRLADLSPLDLALQYKVANGKIGVGDDLVKTGDRDLALGYYEAARQILDHIAAESTDRTSRYELAICYSRIGDVYLFDAKPLSALSAYSKDLALTEPLAAADPKDSSLRAKLVGSKSSVAEAMLRAGRINSGRIELQNALIMALGLVASANNSLTQSYLAAVEMWTGEADEQAGDLPQASDSYRRALHRFSEMSAADPKDLDDAVNVVEAHNHLAGTRLKAGDTQEAAAEYQKALALAEVLASTDKENMAVVYAVADSQAGVGDLSVAVARKGPSASSRRASWSRAQSSYQDSLRAWGQINNPSRIAPNGFWASDPHQITRRLDQCNAELKRINRMSPSPVSKASHEH